MLVRYFVWRAVSESASLAYCSSCQRFLVKAPSQLLGVSAHEDQRSLIF
jgi:hypothetical protein